MTSNRIITACVLVFGLLVAPRWALAKEAAEEEIDYLALGARLLQDGHYDRAGQILQEVDEAAEDLDKKLYFVLKGLVALHKKLYVEAGDSFDAAISAGNHDPLVYINLARARFGSKDYKATVLALKAAGPSAQKEAKAEMLLCQAHWELGATEETFRVLARASKNFPEQIEFARLEMIYLMKLQLFQELSRRRTQYLKRANIEAKDLVAIGEGMRQGGHLKEAKATLEAARLRFPEEVGLTVLLSRVYMDTGELLAAAMLLEQAARHDDKYLVESAEMYRRAGRLVRALVMNKQIPDQKSKMRQRLQILLELQRFEMISGMEDRLSRLGLLEDQQIRYALAYGLFQTRDFAGAEKHIRFLQDPSFFEKGITLRKAIEACKDAGWLCE